MDCPQLCLQMFLQFCPQNTAFLCAVVRKCVRRLPSLSASVSAGCCFCPRMRPQIAASVHKCVFELPLLSANAPANCFLCLQMHPQIIVSVRKCVCKLSDVCIFVHSFVRKLLIQSAELSAYLTTACRFCLQICPQKHPQWRLQKRPQSIPETSAGTCWNIHTSVSNTISVDKT